MLQILRTSVPSKFAIDSRETAIEVRLPAIPGGPELKPGHHGEGALVVGGGVVGVG